MMELYKCGDEVFVNGIKGFITGISIRFCNVLYEVSYFVGNDHKVVWLHEIEFQTDVEKAKIGFK